MSGRFFIVGATAVGKTELAATIAVRCNGEIVNADAFQIYQGMDILTAKPSRLIRDRVRHHLIDIIPISKSYDVAQYLETAERCIAEISARKSVPLIVGGTGLYVRALTRGLSNLPTSNQAIRGSLEKNSLEELQVKFADLDPAGAAKIDLKNKRRLVRAIEVCILTGERFSNYQTDWKRSLENLSGVILTRNREDLYERINKRVEQMFQSNLVEEVKNLSVPGITAAQVIGFKEVQGFLNGEMNKVMCIQKIQQSTRQYAKRQLTWFARETMFETINLSTASNLGPIIELILRKIPSASVTGNV